MARPTLLALLLLASTSFANAVVVEGPENEQQFYRENVPRLMSEVERALGFSYRGGVRVRLADTEAQFLRWLDVVPDGDGSRGRRRPPDWAAAVAVPSEATLVVRLKAAGAYRGLSLNSVLRHELVHVMLPERLGRKTRLPRWFEEGLAQIVGGRVNRSDLDRLPLVAAAGNLIPLAELADGFPRDRERAALAYAEGESIVQYFLTRYGHDKLTALLSATAREGSFEAALQDEIGLDLLDFESQWQDWVKDEKPWWLVILSGAFLPLLFFIASLLVIAAWLRARRKQKETYEALEEG